MKFLRYMLFLPSVTFGIISSEIFPWAFFYSTLSFGYRKIKISILFATFILIIFVIGSVYFFQPQAVEILKFLFAYLNIAFIFWLFLNLGEQQVNKVLKTIKIIIVGLFIFGVLQFFGFTKNFADLYTFLIPRGNYQKLGDIGRGVSLLSTEPSRAALEFVFLTMFYRKFIKNHKTLFDIAVISFVILVIQGGYSLLYSSVYIFFTISKKNAAIFLALFSSLIIFNIERILSFRGFKLINGLIESGEFWETLINLSGARLTSFIAHFNYGIRSPFGAGFGNWKESSIKALEFSGLDPSSISYFIWNSNGHWIPIRPPSIFTSLLMDFGVIGAAVLLICFYFLIRDKAKVFKNNIDVYVAFSIYFFVFGYLGNPIPVIVMALCLNTTINYNTLRDDNRQLKT